MNNFTLGLKITLVPHTKNTTSQVTTTRRVGVSLDFNFEALCEMIECWIPDKGIHKMTYIDDEDDVILLSVEDEWSEAKSIFNTIQRENQPMYITIFTCSKKNSKITKLSRSTNKPIAPTPKGNFIETDPPHALESHYAPILLQGAPVVQRRNLPPTSSLREVNYGVLTPSRQHVDKPVPDSSGDDELEPEIKTSIPRPTLVPKIKVKQELSGWHTAQLCPTCQVFTNTGTYPGHCCFQCATTPGEHGIDCKKFLFDKAVEMCINATPRDVDTPGRELLDKTFKLLIGIEGRNDLYNHIRTPRTLGCGDWLSDDLTVNTTLLQERIQNLGYVALASKNPSLRKQAIEYYRLGVELQPEASFAWLNLARALCADDQKSESIEAIDMAIDRNSTVDISKDPAFFPLRGMHRFVRLCRITRSLTNSSCASEDTQRSGERNTRLQ